MLIRVHDFEENGTVVALCYNIIMIHGIHRSLVVICFFITLLLIILNTHYKGGELCKNTIQHSAIMYYRIRLLS